MGAVATLCGARREGRSAFDESTRVGFRSGAMTFTLARRLRDEVTPEEKL